VTARAVRIPDDLRAAIYAHARAAFPAECCGYLVGAAGGDAVDEAIACANAHGAGDDRAFAIEGAELLAFARTFRSPRPARVVYHSHTNGRAYFSERDRAVAATPDGPAYDVQHLVVGVIAAGATEAAQFAWSAEARDFVEVARWSTRAVSDAATLAIAGDDTSPERLRDAFGRLHEHARAGGTVELDELHAIADRLAAAVAVVPEHELAAHREWARPRKYVPGARQPGKPVAAILAANSLEIELRDLRYELARMCSPAPCDCAILVELGIVTRRPTPAPRWLDGDGMYWDDFECDACGARWTEHKDCDDVGVHSQWQPTKPRVLG